MAAHILLPYTGETRRPDRGKDGSVGATTGVAALLKGVRLAVIGGDRRELQLVGDLVRAGAEVNTAGLPTEGEAGIRTCTDVDEAVVGAEAVVLPMSGADVRGNIATPLLPDLRLPLDESLFALLGPRIPLFIGVLNPVLVPLANRYGVRVIEMAEVDEIAIANSIPTAEGAIQLAMEKLPVTLHDAQVLVLGFGRCGMTLATTLAALGARVGVVARQAAHRARAAQMGLQPWPWPQLPEAVVHQQAIFNTVPTVTLTKDVLTRTRRDVLIVDIASAPGGTNFEAAKRLGRRAILALGLPGKVAPVTAGKILARHLPTLIRAELHRL